MRTPRHPGAVTQAIRCARDALVRPLATIRTRWVRGLHVSAILVGSCALFAGGCAAATGVIWQEPADEVDSSEWRGEEPLLRVYYPAEILARNVACQLEFDERLCKALPNNGRLEIPIVPGEHVLALRGAVVNFVARRGHVVYVRAGESAWSGAGELTVVPDDVGAREFSLTRSVEDSDLPPFTCDQWPPYFNDPAAAGLSDADVVILHNANGPWPSEKCNARNCTFQVHQLRRTGDGQTLYTDPPPSHPYRYLGRVYWFRLHPGRYEITYRTDARPGQKYVARTDNVELRAGHVYRAKQQYECVGLGTLIGFGCKGHWRASALAADGTLWIEDTTTGDIVAGEKWY